jgi:hypothetical protein
MAEICLWHEEKGDGRGHEKVVKMVQIVQAVKMVQMVQMVQKK